MYEDLQQFISALDQAGELRRINAQVSPLLEIGEITDGVSKSAAPSAPSDAAKTNDPKYFDRGGHALLFENVEGSDIPVLINAFGTYRRMEMALGCDSRGSHPGGFEALAAQIAQLVKLEPPRSLGDAVKKLRKLAPVLRLGPKRVKQGICQEVIHTGDQADLRTLPLIRCWPSDGDLASVGWPPDINASIDGAETGDEWNQLHQGRYITFAGVHTIHADDAGASRPASHNVGMYRMQMLGKQTLAMHWHMHHDGAAHWRSWKALGKPMPVAIALGGEAVMPYAATSPLPPGISELLMAGFLQGRGIKMVKAKTVPLWVPANSEIVIEGYVSTESGPPGWHPDSGEPLGPGGSIEGPFGDHTGFYSLPDRYPVMKVSAITHRRNPVFPATIVGLPPQEDYYMGKATERIFLPLLQTLIHDIQDYDLPMFGAFHNCVFVKIRKEYPLQARRVMHSIWGAGQMAWTKTIFVVDDDVDVHDSQAVLERAAEVCDPRFDIESVRGPLDILDHAAPWLGAGAKCGFDCTRKWPDERVPTQTDKPASLPSKEQADDALTKIRALPGIKDAALAAKGWLLLSAQPKTESEAIKLAEDAVRCWQAPPPFLVLVDSRANIRDADEALFHWCANVDMARDMRLIKGGGVDGGDVRAFLATSKPNGYEPSLAPVRDWPPILKMDDAIRGQVQDRWAEYGLG